MAAEAQSVTAPETIFPKVSWPLLVGVALGTVSQTITAYISLTSSASSE
jgi:hypothetical protein